MMVFAVATTFVAIAAILGVVGYRFFNWEGREAREERFGRGPREGREARDARMPREAIEATASLPKGARVLASTVGEGRLVVTVDVAGSTEIHIFDLRTLRRIGRLTFTNEP